MASGSGIERLASGFGLVEAPLWDPQRGLIFSDVLKGGVHRIGADGVVSTLFPHRRGIGGMALHAAGGVVVSGRNVAFKPFDGGATVTLLDRDPDAGNVGYNDLTTDPEGRIYVGSLGASPVFEDGREPAAGALWLIDLDGSSHMVASDVRLTNGLGVSPDGRWLYHSDSGLGTVLRYARQPGGRLGPKERFLEIELGVPDGLAVGADGSVWVALARGGHGVAVFEPDGRRRDFLEISEPMCSSVCFGGPGLDDLYIVSGSNGTGSEERGGVYRLRGAGSGQPISPGRTPVRG